MTPSDWLLLAVDTARPRALKPVQLQKTLFLLDRRLQPEQKGMPAIYAFAPYDYGPFDAAIYGDAEQLAASGLVTISRPEGSSYKSYGITDDGHDRAKAIAQTLPPNVLEFARQVVQWTMNLSFNQLVSAVYKEYPDMKVNSVFKG